MGKVIAYPSDTEAEGKVLAVCFDEQAGFDMRGEVLSRLTHRHFGHPHHELIFMSMEEAQREAGTERIHHTDVMAMLPQESQSKRTLRELVFNHGEPMSNTRLGKLIDRIDEQYRAREVIRITDSVNNIARSGRGSEASDLLMDGLFALTRDRMTGGAQEVGVFAEEYASELTARREQEGIVGVETSIEVFDDVFGGMHDEELTVLAARPGGHKTNVACQTIMHAAKEAGERVLMQSSEMSGTQLVARWACRFAGIPMDLYTKGMYSREQEKMLRDAAQLIKQQRIIIDPTPYPTTMDIRKNLIRWVPDYCVVDYLGIIKPPKPSSSEYQDVTNVVQDINAMKKDFKLPLLLLSQLSRKVEEEPLKRPNMSHLRMSGVIEAVADRIVLLYYPKMYAQETSGGNWYIQWGKKEDDIELIDPNELEFIVGKNRFGPSPSIKNYVEDKTLLIKRGKSATIFD